ncbi:hypothetical protein KUTeg_024715 [Tegillarca granosa]|uniref:Gem-associated protein 5 TPR domain-containing protein n=1 Tax=Tegillarca granosa TaxID=220873 RepID=A0ABQ9E244_TEGGR|nr:hypothetical protein KUTeg_024715 [Tegillarca granosa]
MEHMYRVHLEGVVELADNGQYHRDHDNMDYFYQLEIWKGNINGALRLAREREELSDWLVAMAPMAAFDTWITICEDYATQLEADGQYHKAATYLLAAHKVYGAIELFKRHRLFNHLAMKQVQDAALLLARRYNQSSLQTAARISLIANEKQQALVYGQKVIQNNLLQSDWNEAYKFLKGQKNLQALLAVAGMHELLVREVTHGNPVLLSVNQDKFTTWEDISSQKSFLPDFILDSEVTDPVLPWQPHLIAGHTFPHHVLRIWYGNLGITMDTASIEEMYRALSVLHAGRQVQSDIQQLLVDVSIDLVLCMLSLLMSETPTAITHLLQAVSSLHDAEHRPKYILKLQQEVTAMRVVISMESSSRIDGASKVHTIKRYLSELKEEDSVSNRGLRCRELDCLRAYYYLSILYYLRKRVLERETTATKENEEKVVEMIEKLDLENNEIKENNLVEKSSSLKLDSANDVDNSVVSMETKPELKIVDSTSEINESDEKSVLIDSNTSLSSEKDSEKSSVKSELENVKSSSSVDASEINREANKMVENKASDTGAASCDKVDSKKTSDKDEPIDVGASACDKSDDTPILPPFDISKKSYGNVEKPLPEDKNKDGSENDTFLLKYHLTISKLSHLSRGLLWDIQGKRYALTETLGYIHKAISQLLLAQRPSSLSSSTQSENAPPEPSTNEIPQAIGGSLVPEPMSVDMGEVSSPLERLAFDDNFPSIEQHSCKKRHLSESAVSPPKINVGSGSHHHDHNCPIFSRSVSADPTTDNQSFDIHIPHHGHLCVSSTDDADSGLFDLCSSCELITKSRKVLWEDEPRFPFESIDHGKGKLTSIVNPAKYINVPDEWYNMAADQKYFMPYVTMAILKDEQEYMMHELKRGPDAIQVPFPNPMDSVKILLSMCSSDLFTQAERNQFAEKTMSILIRDICSQYF